MSEPNLRQIKANNVFDLEKFEFPFTYNRKLYSVIIYFKEVHSIELEESLLITKKFEGEYIIDNKRYMFRAFICKEHYYNSQVIDSYWYAASYQQY